MSPTAPVNRPQELDGSPDGCGLASPLRMDSSTPPPPHRLSIVSRFLNATSLSESRLVAFSDAWTRTLPPNHPMLDIGRQVLHELYSYVHLEQSTDLWCYPPSSIQPLDLMQHVQSDLDAVSDLPEHTILADQRTLPRAPLTLGYVARAALNTCSPVAFDVPHTTAAGMRAAPDACVPHYNVHTADRTVVVGAGAVLAPRRSTGSMSAVLHVVLGQIVLLHLPLTHANARGPPDGSSLKERFLWALSQPAAVFRVLYPGESAFVPAMHWRCMIALGCHGSSFSATVFLYVRPVEQDAKFGEEEERARKRARAK